MTTRFKKFIAAAISAAMVMSSFAVFAANDGVLPKDEVIQSADTAEPETTASPETPDMSVWDIPTTFGLDSEAAEPMALSAEVTASGKCGDNLTWTLDSNGTLTISGTGDMYNYGPDNTPWINYKNNLRHLIISEGVTSIGRWSFANCNGFTGDLLLPDGVTSIGERAFSGCSNFNGALVLPDSVTNIGFYTFYDCNGFTGNLIIPYSVTSIDEGAFCGCRGFTGDLVLPDNITQVSNSTFCNCTGLNGALIIPDGVTNIGKNAFYDCDFTGDLIVPDGVVSIGESAFYTCSNFDGVLVIPDSVTSIGRHAFNSCRKLKGPLVIPDGVTSIEDGAFFACQSLTGNLVIPDGVTSIGEFAFDCCSNLTGNLVIPDGVTSVGKFAFERCYGLTGNLVIADSVTFIDDEAFADCDGLTDMYIPQNEDSIGTGDFPNRVHWKYDLSKCTATIKDYTCTGEAIIPTEDSITVTSPNGKTLYYGTDYVITGANNNTNVGTATAHIAPPAGGISIMSQDVPFNIVGIDISGAAVTFPEDITYQGEPCRPEPTVVVNGMTLTKGTDYTVEYSDNNAVGTGKAKITGIGNYIGSVNAEFEIGPYKPKPGRDPVSITERDVVSAYVEGTFIYDGIAKEPKPVLVYHFTNQNTGVTLDYDMIEGKDYEIVSYMNNVNAGKAIVTLRGIGSFKDESSIFFNISPCELSATTIADIPSAEYCKKDICPDPEIKIGDKVMVKDVDYELSYENNRNAGTATVTIIGKGNLSGTVSKNFEITPRDGTKFTIVIWL